MQTIDNMVAVMTAAKEGKTIQSRYHDDINAGWVNTTSPLWNWAKFDYRVKPAEQHKTVEFKTLAVGDIFEERGHICIKHRGGVTANALVVARIVKYDGGDAPGTMLHYGDAELVRPVVSLVVNL